MGKQRAIRVGDQVRHKGQTFLTGTVERMHRADRDYHRRATVKWDTGRTETLAASNLVLYIDQ